jgi:hypothetical protein
MPSTNALCGVAAAIFATAHHGGDLRRWRLRVLQVVTPESATFGKPFKPLDARLAEVCFARPTPRLVSDETMRLALRRLRVSWKRAQHWMTSPAPA